MIAAYDLLPSQSALVHFFLSRNPNLSILKWWKINSGHTRQAIQQLQPFKALTFKNKQERRERAPLCLISAEIDQLPKIRADTAPLDRCCLKGLFEAAWF